MKARYYRWSIESSCRFSYFAGYGMKIHNWVYYRAYEIQEIHKAVKDAAKKKLGGR